ncbi:MAG: hypothetical protein CFE21_03190 [Bacteroidetes bacterium B1(2017)]|nr:MAG: hypothetical protein CFE21_03190 [Bacteroidetes bacterium B1(2017)]
MYKHREIIWWLLLMDICISSMSLIWGLLSGVSLLSLICLVPILIDVYVLSFIKKGDFDKGVNLTVFSVILSVYLVDSGIFSNTGTFLFYIPILIGIYLFEAIGAKRIVKMGILYICLAVFLVNIGWSPRLLFIYLGNINSLQNVFIYSIVMTIVSSIIVLQLFSKLRKDANEANSINQANIIALLENSKDAIWSVDMNLNLISYNSIYASMFKGFWQKEPSSGVSILFPEGKHKIYDDWNSWYRRGLKGESFSFDQEYRFREGSKIFEVSFTPILKEQKQHGMVVKAIDITQRKRAFVQQQLILENLELLLSSTQEIIFEMDGNDRCKKVWKGENLVMMFEDSYFLNKTVEELFDDYFSISLSKVFYEVKADGIPREYEYSYANNGVLKHYVAKLRRIKNSKPPRVSILIDEITHKKEAQIEHEHQRVFLNKLIAHLPIGVFVKSVKDNLTYTLWNKELEYLFELKEEEVIGKTDEEVFKDSGEISTYLATDQMVLTDKEPVLIQKLSIQAGAKQIFARTFKIPLLDADGNVESILGILENISDVVKSQQELENAEKRWNYALSGSRDAVWDVNLVTDESFYSPIFNEMLGFKAFENVEEKWENLVHPDDLVRAWNLFVDHLEGKTHFYECEYRLRNKHGEYIWILDRGKVAETDPDGNPTRIIGTFSNIDYRKRLEEEYKIALQKAEEASKAKSLFLSTMSHEIRTPMNGVIGIINLLLNENKNSEETENLQALKYSADNLMFLLNDILDFSKIDAGKIDIEESSFDLYATLQNTLKSFVNPAKEKSIQLDLKASNNFPKALLGDALRLNQIFNNLISNAIKFTPAGSVKVAALTEELTADYLQVKFTFEDTGIGIDESYIPHLFEHFTQASSDTTRKFGGTGLGLAICQRLVEVLGGNLQVSSVKGEGTTFWFSLKFKIDKNKISTFPKDEESKFTHFRGMHVLLVEDNQMNVFVARKFLTRWEIEIDVAENGRQALSAVQKKRYDLILMDLQMPEMDGFESAERMRKAGLTTPIFALSANVNSEAKQRVQDIGMNEYISKPFNPDDLFQKIAQYYKPKRQAEPSFDSTGKLF